MNLAHPPRRKGTPMEPVALPLAIALGIGGVGAQAGKLAAAIDGDPTTAVTATFWQLGVTGACIVVAWFMLRRSDGRDRTAQGEVDKARANEEKARQQAYRQLELRAEAERKRADAAEDRAGLLADRLAQAFRDDAPEQM